MKFKEKTELKKNFTKLTQKKGISLVVLIVTIIVMIILAAVVILTINKNNLIESAKEATFKEDVRTFQDELSLTISKEYTGLQGQRDNKINAKGFNNISKYISSFNKIYDGKFQIIEDVLVYCGDNKEEKSFCENLEVPILIIDEYAGDLTKGGKFDGESDETAYKINCIEDLVDWSENWGKYNSKHIKLERNLDFNSPYSYSDYTTIKYGDINNDEKIEGLLKEVTTGTGFIPISQFSGTFDGNNNEIKNIYINNTGNVGIFAQASGLTVRNLSITGKIVTSNGQAGGIVGHVYCNAKIYNCNNKCTVISQNSYAGGIIGQKYLGGSEFFIINCCNSGYIFGKERSGGIVGSQNHAPQNYIINSYNIGKIEGGVTAGIIAYTDTINNIINCYNAGEVVSTNYITAGLIGRVWAKEYIINKNSCYLDDSDSEVALFEWNYIFKYIGNKVTKEYMQSEQFVNELNKFIEDYEPLEGQEDIKLLKWKYTPGQFPSFEK